MSVDSLTVPKKSEFSEKNKNRWENFENENEIRDYKDDQNNNDNDGDNDNNTKVVDNSNDDHSKVDIKNDNDINDNDNNKIQNKKIEDSIDNSWMDTDIEEIDLNPQNAIKLSSSPPRNHAKKGMIYYMDKFVYICMYIYVRMYA
jgi:hypothetical protein